MEYPALFSAIVSNLPGWSIRPIKEGEYSTPTLVDITNGVAEFSIRAQSYGHAGRLVASGQHRPGSITTSETRAPAAIAKDIEKRLLPGVIEAHRKHAAYERESMAKEICREALADRMVTASGGILKRGCNQQHASYEVELHDSYPYHYPRTCPGLSVQTNSDGQVRIKASDLSPVLAEKIITMIAMAHPMPSKESTNEQEQEE